MRRTIIALILSLSSIAALGQLSEYQDWAKGPEGYFLTAAERDEWSLLKSDADAEAFIGRYFERRGGESFRKELAHRIQMTDKYLSLEKKKGSETLRGKFAILFGPPTKMERTTDTKRAGRGAAITPMADPGGTDRAPGGVSLGEATSAATGITAVGSATASNVVVDVMTWSGPSLPKPLTDAITIRIEVDSALREKLQGSKSEIQKLNNIIESVVRASLRDQN